MANRSSRELPGPRWNAAHLRQRLREGGYAGALPSVAWFGDSAEQADQLAELVRRGRKRATASLLWRWEDEGGPPQPGDRQVIIDWQGEPRTAHWDFFARECDRLGRAPSGAMPVVCMRFRIVHPESP